MVWLFEAAVSGFHWAAFVAWLFMAAVWAIPAWLAYRKWGRKAMVWIALSVPLAILAIVVLTFMALLGICAANAASGGCMP
jgi:hypothetical protein